MAMTKVTAKRSSMMRRVMTNCVDKPRDPAWDMTEADLYRNFDWARNLELRNLTRAFTAVTCTLIQVRTHMVDKDDDAYYPLHMIEDELIRMDERLRKVLEAIDPQAEALDIVETAQA